MSYASGTTHYNLPQTVGSDKRDWTDTNQAFSDIDAAIYGAAQGASAATSAIATINGQIETITAAQAVDEGNISTLSGKVSTLESTVGTQGAAIADVRQDLQDNIESNHEASATSAHAYEIGDTFYYNDVLYKATADIAIGGTIVPSTNCTAVTVMSELASQNAGDIDYNNTSSGLTADNVQAAIDEVNAKITNAPDVTITLNADTALDTVVSTLVAAGFEFNKMTPFSKIKLAAKSTQGSLGLAYRIYTPFSVSDSGWGGSVFSFPHNGVINLASSGSSAAVDGNAVTDLLVNGTVDVYY